MEDPLEGVTVFEYDENGNVTGVTDADEHTTTFTLDGRNRVIQIHDAPGNDSYRIYDAGGRLTQSEDHRLCLQAPAAVEDHRRARANYPDDLPQLWRGGNGDRRAR